MASWFFSRNKKSRKSHKDLHYSKTLCPVLLPYIFRDKQICHCTFDLGYSIEQCTSHLNNNMKKNEVSKTSSYAAVKNAVLWRILYGDSVDRSIAKNAIAACVASNKTSHEVSSSFVVVFIRLSCSFVRPRVVFPEIFASSHKKMEIKLACFMLLSPIFCLEGLEWTKASVKEA